MSSDFANISVTQLGGNTLGKSNDYASPSKSELVYDSMNKMTAAEEAAKEIQVYQATK